MVIIKTAQEFSDIRNNLKGQYELANDIDLSSFAKFTPIGDATTPFEGELDGKGFKITNLVIDSSSAIGLFGTIKSSLIQNLELKDVDILGSGSNVGCVAGISTLSTFSKIKTSGKVAAMQGNTGGLVGNFATGTIINCFTSMVENFAGRGNSGGLVGSSTTAARIEKSYSNGVGGANPQYGAHKAIIGSTASPVIANVYFNSGKATDTRGKALTDAQMKLKASFVGFSEDDWVFATGTYPDLLFPKEPEIPPTIETVEVASSIKEFYQSVKTVKNANIKTASVQSYVESFELESIVIAKATRVLTSSMEPFGVTTKVIIKEFPVYANVFAIENATEMSVIE
ncbi:MAG TPA: hypothetical protein K8V56_10615 [Sporosarcina psychrophila]|uniref:Peptidase M26 N-terminal domain-containing protein n=1 Tax=Sporosarcina psychrophila TaxID=1476 RepID=A0A921G074_SPOPS|nr:hypothetical protein [Sporosarcina psychrophila]